MDESNEKHFRQIDLGNGRQVFANPALPEREVKGAVYGAQQAADLIVETLRDNNVHPVDALNALLNVWYGMARIACPQDIPRAIESLAEFHRQGVVSRADA